MANTTRDIFRKACNYAHNIMQKGKAFLDPDINDSHQIQFYQMKDLIDTLSLTGFLDAGFTITEASVGNQENNFNVTMGIGYADGLRVYQEATAALVPTAFPATQSQKNLCSVISSVSTETIVDYRRNWTVNALVGRKVYIFGDGIGVNGIEEYTVTSNTTNSITFSGENLVSDGVTALMPYAIKPSTPAGAREDAILLNVFLDEVSAAEDNVLYHSLGGDYENDRRKKIRAIIEVEEDITYSSYTVPSSYTDLLGNYHTYVLLGYLTRSTGESDIDNSMITDARTDLKNLGDFVLKTGDTMTGDLNMSSGANINLDSGDITLTAGDIRLIAGDLDLSAGDITLSGGDLDMNSGSIRGDGGGYINFATSPNEEDGDTVGDFKHLSGRNITVLDENLVKTGRFIHTKDSTGMDILSLVQPETGDLQKLEVETPSLYRQATNKSYVDSLINSHRHEEYVTYESLGRFVILSFAGLTGIVTNNWANGAEVEVPHNLGDSFVNTVLQINNGSDWTQPDPGNFDIRIIDSNTVGITNRTGSPITDSNARCSVIKAGNSRVIIVVDTIDSLRDSISFA